MNDNSYTDKLLDDLLRGRVDRAAAEAMLATRGGAADPAREIDLHLAAAKAVQQYNLLMQVQAVHQQYANGAARLSALPAQRPKVVAMPVVRWALRTAAVVALFAAGWLTYQYTTATPDNLYAELYQPYYVNTDRGAAEGATYNLVDRFKAADYPGVVAAFGRLPTTGNREKFLAAYAHHQLGNQPLAIGLLQQVLQTNRQNGGRLYNDEAEFYLGLSYLKNGNTTQAAALFASIRSNASHTFHQRVGKWTVMRMKWLGEGKADND